MTTLSQRLPHARKTTAHREKGLLIPAVAASLALFKPLSAAPYSKPFPLVNGRRRKDWILVDMLCIAVVPFGRPLAIHDGNGRGGIRTHGGFPHARFRVECLKPDSATLPRARYCRSYFGMRNSQAFLVFAKATHDTSVSMTPWTSP